jgi:hypothetical protein
MTALPSNLAMIGEDLAHATLADVRQAARRRRIATFAVALAVLALTASAAIATGWLSEKTPAARAVPSLTGGPGDAEPQVLLTDLGTQARELSRVLTAAGGVCVSVTGFERQCVPTFLANQQIAWFVQSLPDGTTAVFGIARGDVMGIDGVASDGRAVAARLANGAFYLEFTGVSPTQVTVHLRDGSSNAVAIAPCPPASPDCVS